MTTRVNILCPARLFRAGGSAATISRDAGHGGRSAVGPPGPYAVAVSIDLHAHSVVSDGTGSPGQVVADAAAAGLDVIALTDHDTTAGWAEAAEAARRLGVALVRGAEISARADGIGVHILAYLPDPTDPDLLGLTRGTRSARAARARRMVERLGTDFPITWADVVAQTQPGTTIGRPHMADALVAAGVVPNRQAAFADILRSGSRYYERYPSPEADDVVRVVQAAGGVPVFAHPGAQSRGRIVDDDAIRRLAAAGLAGLEVRHRDNDDEQRARLAGLAAELGLFVTGSSDYHGAGKPNRLGENTTTPEVLAAIEAAGRVEVIR